MSNTASLRSETAGIYLCQQQAVSVHLYLHWVASHSAPLDQAKQWWEETHGMNKICIHNIKQFLSNNLVRCFRKITNVDKFCFCFLFLPCIVFWMTVQNHSSHLVFPPCCRWLCQCTWTSPGRTSSSLLTLTLPPRKIHIASMSAELLSCALSRWPKSFLETRESLLLSHT